MNRCQNCEVETNNPKFCSRSCSAKSSNKNRNRYANKTTVKGANRSAVCLNCGNIKSVNPKFCSELCANEYKRKQVVKGWLETGIITRVPIFGSAIRNFIYEQQNHLCAICSRTNLWEGKELRFVLDHIDGNSDNNFRSNLRLICPNCDSQLETFKSKNKNSGRAYRRERYAAGKSF